MTRILFLGNSRDAIRDFQTVPDIGPGSSCARCRTDWIRTTGSRWRWSVREIRIRDTSGAYRIICLATLADRGRRAGVRPCGS